MLLTILLVLIAQILSFELGRIWSRDQWRVLLRTANKAMMNTVEDYSKKELDENAHVHIKYISIFEALTETAKQHHLI